MAMRGVVGAAVLTALLLVPVAPAGAVDDLEVERDEVEGRVKGDAILGVTRVKGGWFAITNAGFIVRKRGDGPWRVDGTATGFGRGGVVAIAANEDRFVAVGFTVRGVPGNRDYPPAAWHSADGITWEAANVDAVGGAHASFYGVVRDGDRFLAFGSRGRGEARGFLAATLWKSADGRSWSPLDAPGLDLPGEYATQDVVGLAIGPEGTLAVQGTECAGCSDDYALTLARGELDGDWDDLEFEGLDAFEQPNTDVIPPVVAIGDQYVVFGVRGEKDPALATFSSDDGEQWSASGGETDEPDDDPEAVASNGDEAVALVLNKGKLHAWTIRLD